MFRLICFLVLMVAGWTLSIQPLFSQARSVVSQDVLVLNQERLLRDSKKGKLILAEEANLKQKRAERATALEAELEADEKSLAERKDELDPKEFEQLAEAFDARVVAIRQEDVQAAEVLAAEFEGIRKDFFADVVPIVAQIMAERGASLVFEQRNVLFTGPNVDITDDVIARMDKAAGLD